MNALPPFLLSQNRPVMISTRAYLIVIAILMIASLLLLRQLSRGNSVSVQEAEKAARAGCGQVAKPFRQHQSDLWLSLSGIVTRVLPDEAGRFQHQRFIVSCPSGQTVLIVNDVSIGERVAVHVGDKVIVRGQYVWNAEGGLVHFTHHAEGGGQGGWIEFDRKVYSLGPTLSTEM